ncbi:uncharacterized protein LOC134543133 isoform X2 [Bacillus rossius redtenbacheri]|uniref:uncharacterized protein LOC134543133 isoform X2 n=1 Tax=Bacillus rossius redtenbacheri TaxID=93214 RepID=UPI002FDEA430
MRLCCCDCCDCCDSNSSVVDSTELLHCPGIGEGSQYYTVRRISSFGRAASQEDLEGSCQDLCEVSKDVADTPDDISVFTPLADKYSGGGADPRTGVAEPDSCALPPLSAAKKQPQWRKALHGLKPRPGRLRSKSPAPVPPIIISSPSNVDDTSLALPQSKLRHVLTMSDVSSVGLTDHPQVFRFKSRSMQDINSSGDLHRDGKFSEEARRLARSVGLNVSLYPSEPPPHHRSAETLGPSETPRGDDSRQECGCGRVHFFVTHYPKDKKLLVNVTQLEGLPPRNDYQDYTVALKVQILPAEKPAKTARLGGQEIDEDFYFSLKDARGKAVRLSVFDADRMGKHDAIGHALVRLDADAIRATQLYTVDLQKQSELDVMPGSIQLTIGYDSEAQRLSVLVAAASNLSTSHLSKASKQPGTARKRRASGRAWFPTTRTPSTTSSSCSRCQAWTWPRATWWSAWCSRDC